MTQTSVGTVRPHHCARLHGDPIMSQVPGVARARR